MLGRLTIVAIAVLAVAAQIWWASFLVENVERLRGCSNSDSGDGCSYARLGYVVWAVVEFAFLALLGGLWVALRRVQSR